MICKNFHGSGIFPCHPPKCDRGVCLYLDNEKYNKLIREIDGIFNHRCGALERYKKIEERLLAEKKQRDFQGADLSENLTLGLKYLKEKTLEKSLLMLALHHYLPQPVVEPKSKMRRLFERLTFQRTPRVDAQPLDKVCSSKLRI